jgi:hypothetical protein
MTEYRIERDSMGEMRVPATAPALAASRKSTKITIHRLLGCYAWPGSERHTLYTGSGSNRSSILPLLSPNRSTRTPTRSSSVRCRFASGAG